MPREQEARPYETNSLGDYLVHAFMEVSDKHLKREGGISKGTQEIFHATVRSEIREGLTNREIDLSDTIAKAQAVRADRTRRGIIPPSSGYIEKELGGFMQHFDTGGQGMSSFQELLNKPTDQYDEGDMVEAYAIIEGSRMFLDNIMKLEAKERDESLRRMMQSLSPEYQTPEHRLKLLEDIYDSWQSLMTKFEGNILGIKIPEGTDDDTKEKMIKDRKQEFAEKLGLQVEPGREFNLAKRTTQKAVFSYLFGARCIFYGATQLGYFVGHANANESAGDQVTYFDYMFDALQGVMSSWEGVQSTEEGDDAKGALYRNAHALMDGVGIEGLMNAMLVNVYRIEKVLEIPPERIEPIPPTLTAPIEPIPPTLTAPIEPIPPTLTAPTKPNKPLINRGNAKTSYDQDMQNYDQQKQAYDQAMAVHQQAVAQYDQQKQAYDQAMAVHQQAVAQHDQQKQAYDQAITVHQQAMQKYEQYKISREQAIVHRDQVKAGMEARYGRPLEPNEDVVEEGERVMVKRSGEIMDALLGNNKIEAITRINQNGQTELGLFFEEFFKLEDNGGVKLDSEGNPVLRDRYNTDTALIANRKDFFEVDKQTGEIAIDKMGRPKFKATYLDHPALAPYKDRIISGELDGVRIATDVNPNDPTVRFASLQLLKSSNPAFVKDSGLGIWWDYLKERKFRQMAAEEARAEGREFDPETDYDPDKFLSEIVGVPDSGPGLKLMDRSNPSYSDREKDMIDEGEILTAMVPVKDKPNTLRREIINRSREARASLGETIGFDLEVRDATAWSFAVRLLDLTGMSLYGDVEYWKHASESLDKILRSMYVEKYAATDVWLRDMITAVYAQFDAWRSSSVDPNMIALRGNPDDARARWLNPIKYEQTPIIQPIVNEPLYTPTARQRIKQENTARKARREKSMSASEEKNFIAIESLYKPRARRIIRQENEARQVRGEAPMDPNQEQLLVINTFFRVQEVRDRIDQENTDRQARGENPMTPGSVSSLILREFAHIPESRRIIIEENQARQVRGEAPMDYGQARDFLVSQSLYTSYARERIREENEARRQAEKPLLTPKEERKLISFKSEGGKVFQSLLFSNGYWRRELKPLCYKYFDDLSATHDEKGELITQKRRLTFARQMLNGRIDHAIDGTVSPESVWLSKPEVFARINGLDSKHRQMLATQDMGAYLQSIGINASADYSTGWLASALATNETVSATTRLYGQETKLWKYFVAGKYFAIGIANQGQMQRSEPAYTQALDQYTLDKMGITAKPESFSPDQWAEGKAVDLVNFITTQVFNWQTLAEAQDYFKSITEMTEGFVLNYPYQNAIAQRDNAVDIYTSILNGMSDQFDLEWEFAIGEGEKGTARVPVNLDLTKPTENPADHQLNLDITEAARATGIFRPMMPDGSLLEDFNNEAITRGMTDAEKEEYIEFRKHRQLYFTNTEGQKLYRQNPDLVETDILEREHGHRGIPFGLVYAILRNALDKHHINKDELSVIIQNHQNYIKTGKISQFTGGPARNQRKAA